MRDEDIINHSPILLEEPTANATLGSLRETQVTKRPTFPCSKREKTTTTQLILECLLQKKLNGIWTVLVISIFSLQIQIAALEDHLLTTTTSLRG